MWPDGAGPRIVVIGGGSGSSSVLKGLKHDAADLTAIVTMFDSGGSSGLLRREFGYPPLGDLRQCLVALADEQGGPADSLLKAIGFRFGSESSLNGHSMGNLLLAALTSIGNNVEQAIEEMAQMLNTRGQVVPVTLQPADLCAELDNGQVIREESTIDLRKQGNPRIVRVFLDRPVTANPRAVQAILEADAVVLGPGDLYTSVIPNLLADGIPQALAETRAKRIYVCNLMTKLGETDGFKASDFVQALKAYMAPAPIDWVIVNTQPISNEVLAAYDHEDAYPVAPDVAALARHVGSVYTGAMMRDEVPVRHHPERVAEAVLRILGSAAPAAPAVPTNGKASRARRNGAAMAHANGDRNGYANGNGRHPAASDAETPSLVPGPTPIHVSASPLDPANARDII